jgi:hypothetical protein
MTLDTGVTIPLDQDKLHYSQTCFQTGCFQGQFEYPLKLHYSQTQIMKGEEFKEFEYPLKLHYSQTLVPATT